MTESPKNVAFKVFSNEEVHAMRNQLNVILGYTQLLADEENIFDDQKKMLTSMEDSALKMRSTLFQTTIEPIDEMIPPTSTEEMPVSETSLEEVLDLSYQRPLSQKVLIIDDKKHNLSLFKDILLPYGYDVYTASSGAEGLALIDNIMPELILLDVIMPEMNGYEVIEKIKKNRVFQDIPVIFLTANDSPDEIVNGLEAGAIDYISKPFHPKELIARVNTHMEKGRLFANIKRLLEHSFHELYTPLSIISFAMQLQEMQHAKTEYTTNTQAACRSLQTIYDDLYYSIIDRKKGHESSEFDLAVLLKERADYFHLIAQSRNLRMQCSLAENVLVCIEPEAITRVLDNLFSNAIKYTKEGHTISLSLEEIDDSYLLKICNPSQKLLDTEKMFEKYYRHHDEVFGLGLGLELVQGICERYQLPLKATQEENLLCIEIVFRRAS